MRADRPPPPTHFNYNKPSSPKPTFSSPMARGIAVKLQTHAALAVIVRTSGRGVVAEAVVPVALGDGDDPRAVGQKIADALAPFSPGRAPTVIAIPRADLHWANYDLPPAPAADLPDLVLLQAQRDLVLADDGVGFDYVSLHGDEEHPHRILGVGMSPAQLERVRAACAAAELKLQRIVPEPFGWVELGRRAVGEPAAEQPPMTVFAAIAGRQAAVWAMQGDTLRLVRTVWLAPEPDAAADLAALAGELRRTLLSLSQMAGAPSASLPCIYCGENAARVASQLAASLGRAVRGVSLEELVEAPVADDAVGAEVAPLAALGAATASDRPSPVDLLHPHRPPAPPSRRRTYALAATAAACVVLLLAWTAYRKIQSPLEAAAAANKQAARLAPTLKRMGEVEIQAAAVDAWLNQSVNLLTELDYLGQQLRPKPLSDATFNSGEDLIITKLTLAGRQLTIDAAARSFDALAPIESRLRNGQYRVMRVIGENAGEATPGYAARMSDVLERIGGAAATNPPAAAAAATPSAATASATPAATGAPAATAGTTPAANAAAPAANTAAPPQDASGSTPASSAPASSAPSPENPTSAPAATPQTSAPAVAPAATAAPAPATSTTIPAAEAPAVATPILSDGAAAPVQGAPQ